MTTEPKMHYARIGYVSEADQKAWADRTCASIVSGIEQAGSWTESWTEENGDHQSATKHGDPFANIIVERSCDQWNQ